MPFNESLSFPVSAQIPRLLIPFLFLASLALPVHVPPQERFRSASATMALQWAACDLRAHVVCGWKGSLSAAPLGFLLWSWMARVGVKTLIRLSVRRKEKDSAHIHCYPLSVFVLLLCSLLPMWFLQFVTKSSALSNWLIVEGVLLLQLTIMKYFLSQGFLIFIFLFFYLCTKTYVDICVFVETQVNYRSKSSRNKWSNEEYALQYCK